MPRPHGSNSSVFPESVFGQPGLLQDRMERTAAHVLSTRR